jgi:predicted chitinase
MGKEKYYTATRRLDIRSGPGEDYDSWEKLEKGEEIISPVTEGWLPVLMEDETGGDITGWVLGKYLEEEVPDQKPEPSKPGEVPESIFPIFQRNLTRMFGTPSSSGVFRKKNLTSIDLAKFASPLGHVQTWNNRPFTSFEGHRLIEGPLRKALRLVCDRGLAKELKTFDGCWNIRSMKSNNKLSVHSWGLALDFNAGTCPFQDPKSPTWPDLVRDLSDDFVRCFAEAGFEWGGLWKSVHDPMHFQLAWTKDWRDSTVPLRPQVPAAAPAPAPEKPEPEAPTTPGAFDFTTREGTIAAIKGECQRQGIGLPTQMAYVLATTEWETAHTFKPVREAFWKSEEWRKSHLRYHPYYGRGYVQLTWEANYSKYAEILKIDLVQNPDLALDPQNALFILVHGFKNGTFTSKKITEFINEGKTDFVNARRCINRLDHAKEIADLAQDFLKA